MGQKFQAMRGTRDVLPGEIEAWQAVEEAARRLSSRYGFREIRTPLFEATELFARGVGDATDIVRREMYTFPDR
jgi:histidyl-tRNA synthetase